MLGPSSRPRIAWNGRRPITEREADRCEARRPAELDVPGLAAWIDEMRRSYPELAPEALERIFRLPGGGVDGTSDSKQPQEK